MQVKNFDELMVKLINDHANVKPVLNQFLSSPSQHHQERIDFCKDHDIIPEAYQSLVKVDEPTKEALKTIGKRYDKTWSQVIFIYHVSVGLVVIPKSHNPKHQQENIDFFDFTLTPEDTAKIKAMKTSFNKKRSVQMRQIFFK